MTLREAVYGEPPAELAAAAPGAAQLSPLILDSEPIESAPDGSLARLTMLAPPGALERRYAIAQGLRALAPDGEITVLAPKTKGGMRLADELTAYGCVVVETARRHHRICHARRPRDVVGLEAAIASGGPRILEGLGLWTQPGVFSWDRIDPGTALLLETPADLAGRGADLGCGLGVLSRHALRSPAVVELLAADIDQRAVDAARRNIADPRVSLRRQDVRLRAPDFADLDFVIMNPPFHEGGREDRGLGLAFISAAANMLRKGGVCRMVANVALPYEARLKAAFARADIILQRGGYKVYEAVK